MARQQVAPLAFDFYIGLIDIPGLTGFPLTLGSQVMGKQGSKTFFPVPHCLMRKLESSQQKYFCYIPQASLYLNLNNST